MGKYNCKPWFDKKKVIITESTIRRDLQLEDAEGTNCLPNATIFEQLALIGIYVNPSHTKKIFGNMKREGKGFSRRVTPLFQTMMVQAHEEMDEGSKISTDPHHTPIITQPSSSQPQKKQKSRKRMHPNRRNIADIDADVEVTLIDETHERNDDNLIATTTTVDELTIAQTLIEIKAAKPKVRGVIIQETSEFTTTTTTTTLAASKPSQDKVKVKMIKSEKPLKKKDQIIQKEEESNIALIESWDNTEALMDVDYQMAQQLQAEEQEQLSIEEKSKLFFKVIKDMFDKAFKRVNTFVDYKIELVKGSEKRAEDSTNRVGIELEQEVAKKQKIDDAKVDDDQEEARMKELINIFPDEEEVAIDAIPLATKPLCIVDWKIIKEEKNQPISDYKS
ncbi:hypothetical protein Tco_0128287 [Tanacetum coccineum]